MDLLDLLDDIGQLPEFLFLDWLLLFGYLWGLLVSIADQNCAAGPELFEAKVGIRILLEVMEGKPAMGEVSWGIGVNMVWGC